MMNVANWYSLAVAILYKNTLTAETAIALYETGDCVDNERGKTPEVLIEMRESGMTWKEIREATGRRSPESYVSRKVKGMSDEWKKRYRAVLDVGRSESAKRARAANRYSVLSV